MLIGLLCCSVACLELSELASLSDDTSNDCLLQLSAVSGYVTPHADSTRAPISPLGMGNPSPRIEVARVSVVPAIPQRTADDLLHLLSTLRT